MPDIFITKSKEKKDQDKGVPVAPISGNSTIISDENHVHSLASFCTNSAAFSFHAQDPNEKIILFLRRHFITNMGWILSTFIFSIIPLVLFFTGISFFEFINVEFPLRIVTLLIVIYYLLLFTYSMLNFLNWFYNVTIITDKRIVDVDYSGLLYHNVAITKLSQIEDVNYTKAGFLRSIFNFGDVYAQTAGGVSDHFDMLAIPQPEKIANFISDLIGEKHAH